MIGWIGKIVGMLIGWKLLGPIGIIIGVMLGHRLDHYFYKAWQQRHGTTQQVFFNSVFKIMGYVAKADGRVTEQEIQAARRIMQELGLNEAQRLKAIELFTLGKNGDLDLPTELERLKQTCHRQQTLLRLFLEIQLRAAGADGIINQKKQLILQQICQNLGFIQFDFNQSGFNQSNHQNNHYQRSYQQPSHYAKLEAAYKLLAVSKTTSDADVKKAYRKMISQHHPDKLVSKGLPDSMIKMATEKTQQIKAAYDCITQARAS